jgi:release factor glutamine methyltransferase
MDTYTIRKIKQLCNTLITYPENYSERKTPLLDMNCFLQSVLNCTKAFLLSHDDYVLKQNELDTLFEMCNKRCTGLPVAYITGHKEFFGLDFYVTTDVLIPKPDTEILVDKAIRLINENNYLNIADICTGSGCIAISVLKNTKNNVFITATDISEKTLEVAKINAQKLLSPQEQNKISFIHADLFSIFSETITDSNNAHTSVLENFDIIISNPPYIPSELTTRLLEDGRSEPRLALDGDFKDTQNSEKDGTSLIKRLIPESYKRLKNGGILILETGEYNADKTECLMKKNGFINTEIFLDLAGLKRVVLGIKAEN